MKNILFMMLPIVAAVLLATSCSKDDGSEMPAAPDNNNTSSVTTPETNDHVQTVVDGEVPSIPFTITVNKGDDEGLSKAHMSGLAQSFDKGDKLQITSVHGEDISGTLDLVSNPGTTGTFSGTLSGTGLSEITAKTELYATLTNETYGNTGEKLTKPVQFVEIHSASRKCGWWYTAFKYGDASINLLQATAFLCVSNVDKVYVKEPGASDYTTFRVGSGVIAVPDESWVYTSSPTFSEPKQVDVFSSESYSNNKTLALYRIRRNPPKDCIDGLYSISPTTKVFFSKGNLQKGTSTADDGGNWYFADNQWDLGYYGFGHLHDVGENHYDMHEGGKADLFGWGSWFYNPLLTSTTNSDYSWPSSVPHETFEFDGEDWFVLTSEEWDYLLNKSKTAGGVRFIKVFLNFDREWGRGLAVFPDDCRITEDVLKEIFNTDEDVANNKTTGFLEHTITRKDVWEALSSWTDGEVLFLPASRYREGRLLHDVDEGYYWMSDRTSFGGSSVPQYLIFDLSDLKIQPTQSYSKGCAVRLVHAMTD